MVVGIAYKKSPDIRAAGRTCNFYDFQHIFTSIAGFCEIPAMLDRKDRCREIFGLTLDFGFWVTATHEGSSEPEWWRSMPEIYTVREFCAAFRISHATFYALANSGQLRTAKIGGKRVVTRA